MLKMEHKISQMMNLGFLNDKFSSSEKKFTVDKQFLILIYPMQTVSEDKFIL